MKTPSRSPQEKAKAAASRPLGAAETGRPEKDKKLLNLQDENAHSTGKTKLAVSEETKKTTGAPASSTGTKSR